MLRTYLMVEDIGIWNQIMTGIDEFLRFQRVIGIGSRF